MSDNVNEVTTEVLSELSELQVGEVIQPVPILSVTCDVVALHERLGSVDRTIEFVARLKEALA